MPELPEVQCVVDSLQKFRGSTIAKVEIHKGDLRKKVPASLKSNAEGKTIKEISRHGKYIAIKVPGGYIFMHLGMSGSLRLADVEQQPDTDNGKGKCVCYAAANPDSGSTSGYNPPPCRPKSGSNDDPNCHNRVEFQISQGDQGKRTKLLYCAPRGLGIVTWKKGQNDPVHYKPLSKLGIEPLSDEFDGDALCAKVGDSKRQIKDLLMDQERVAGLGNIYAAEALFEARLCPGCSGKTIAATAKENYEELANQIKKTLRKAIDKGGTTLDVQPYKDPDGNQGEFQKELMVYGREGKKCKICETPISRYVSARRSTYYCSECQACLSSGAAS